MIGRSPRTAEEGDGKVAHANKLNSPLASSQVVVQFPC